MTEKSGLVQQIYVHNKLAINRNMKRIGLFILLTILVNSLSAQTALRPINPDSLHSEFLQSITEFPIGGETQDSVPIYSWLNGNAPDVKWSFYGDDNYVKSYKVSVTESWPKESANILHFTTSAYTKGNFILAICSILSFCDISERRLYTYDYNGQTIDSLILEHDFDTNSGHCIMPIAGELRGNLDVKICEIKWIGSIAPYDKQSKSIIGGSQLGQQVDSYYMLDGTGHFVLKKKVLHTPRVYTELDVTVIDYKLKGSFRNIIFDGPSRNIQRIIVS